MINIQGRTTFGGRKVSDLISVWEYNETSGNVVYDSHGSNDGISYNVLVNQTGLLDKSYLYDSGSYGLGYVDIGVETIKSYLVLFQCGFIRQVLHQSFISQPIGI